MSNFFGSIHPSNHNFTDLDIILFSLKNAEISEKSNSTEISPASEQNQPRAELGICEALICPQLSDQCEINISKCKTDDEYCVIKNENAINQELFKSTCSCILPPCEYARKVWEKKSLNKCSEIICPDLQASCLAAKSGIQQCSVFKKSTRRNCVRDINLAMKDALKSVTDCNCTTECGVSSGFVKLTSFLLVLVLFFTI